MSLYHSFTKNQHFKNYGLLLLICLLGYWPLTFGIFSVKNDAIHYFLPYRFHISEALRNGELPFWSPYIYLGNPVYGDMQSGAWNPVVWFFSLFGRYDLTLFHAENLLYIFLGGLGMYKLVHHYVKHSATALLIGASYMLSGFMLGGQLINWLAAAAFIPFVLLYYLRSKTTGGYVDPIKTGLALYFLFTAAYPSFFIITGYILLALFIIHVVDKFKIKASVKDWKIFSFQHLVILIVFIGLSLPAIISWYDLLPYYERGSGVSYNEVIQNSFEARHSLSFIFPSGIKAIDVVSTTDITCRNLYMGLFILPILIAFPPPLSRRTLFLIALATFAFLFSLGDTTPLRKLCYQFIPLMDSFRHPSQVRLFIILPILLLTVPGLKKLLSNELAPGELQKLKRISLGFAVLVLVITIVTFINSNITSYLANFQFSGEGMKKILGQLTLSDVVTANGIIQLFSMGWMLWWLKTRQRTTFLFSAGWIINLFIMAQLVLPISFVGSTSPKTINAFIHHSPRGFPVDSLRNTIAHNSAGILDHYDQIALSGFYNKKITVSRVMNSPAFLSEQEAFILDDHLYNYISSKPVAYIAGQITDSSANSDTTRSVACNIVFTHSTNPVINCDPNDIAIIKKLSANRFGIETNTSGESILVLTQNYHHHWKATIDNKQVPIQKVNKSFMGVIIPKGDHHVVFRFAPGNTIKALYIQGLFILLIAACYILTLARTNKK